MFKSMINGITKALPSFMGNYGVVVPTCQHVEFWCNAPGKVKAVDDRNTTIMPRKHNKSGRSRDHFSYRTCTYLVKDGFDWSRPKPARGCLCPLVSVTLSYRHR